MIHFSRTSIATSRLLIGTTWMAFDVAEHISVLHFGEVLEAGPTEQIRRSEKVQQIYLGTG
jgi:ABC-type branched-subunit amino acid transport system ATPase component